EIGAADHGKEMRAGAFTKENAGDPLPRGALSRVGTVRWRHTGPVNFIEFLPGGQQVVSAARDRYVRIWNFATGKELRRFGPGPRVEQIQRPLDGAIEQNIEPLPPDLFAVSRDGRYLATRFEPRVVDVHEIATGRKAATLSLDHECDAG